MLVRVAECLRPTVNSAGEVIIDSRQRCRIGKHLRQIASSINSEVLYVADPAVNKVYRASDRDAHERVPNSQASHPSGSVAILG